MDEPLDVSNFRLNDSNHREPPKRKPIREGGIKYCKGKFVKGPLPIDWFQMAIRCGFAAFSVAFYLWYYRGLKRTPTFKIGIRELASLIGCSKNKARRGLLVLEKHKLITIERHDGQKNTVTIEKVEEKSSTPAK